MDFELYCSAPKAVSFATVGKKPPTVTISDSFIFSSVVLLFISKSLPNRMDQQAV